MKRYSMISLILLVAVTAGMPLYAQRSSVYSDVGQSDTVPVPRILQPYLDTYDLSGKKELVFKWSPHEGNQTQRDYYDFRLYRGYEAFESTRIYKARVPPRQWSLALSADMFENGRVYTITLRQVYTGSIKSWRAFGSFKIIKDAVTNPSIEPA